MTKLDRVIVARLAQDDGVPYSVSEKMWKASIQEAEKGAHCGDCTREPQTCVVCFVANHRRAAEELLKYVEQD